MTSEQQKFLEILRYCIDNVEHIPSELKMIDWSSFLKFAKEQAIVGVVYGGIERLGKDVNIPFNVLMEWIGAANLIKKTSLCHIQVLKQSHQTLQSAGVEHVFMKGLICGLRYPKPELRSCGDIDFVVSPTDFSKTLKALENIGSVDYDLVHEHHGMAFVNGVTLEPHYKVHNYQLKRHDKAMQAIFNEVFPQRIVSAEIAGVGVPVFPETFESVFLVSHMVNHVFEEGLGLRQVIDYALFLKYSYDKIDRKQHSRWLQKMDMMRAHRIFVRICETYLGLKECICSYEYSNREKAFADKLMEDILSVGNFGRAAYIFEHDSLKSELRNYIWVTKRSFRLGYLCPSEAYMWPISKLTRFITKKINPSRYQDIS